MAQKQKIEKGDLISVPVGNTYLQGTVDSINEENVILENYANGKVKIPNNDLIYKFFPGQKFDLREFNSIDNSSEQGLSIKDKLDAFLSKTEIGSFNSLVKNHPKQVAQLLAGKLTSNLYNGVSLIQNQKEETKELKPWSAKFQLYRAADKSLKLDVKFQHEKLNVKIYGKELAPEQIALMKEKKQTIVLDLKNKQDQPFKVFAKYDKDLNRFITSPYNKKIEERMKASYSKKEDQIKSKENKNTKGETANKEITTAKKPQRKIKSRGV